MSSNKKTISKVICLAHQNAQKTRDNLLEALGKANATEALVIMSLVDEFDCLDLKIKQFKDALAENELKGKKAK